MPNKTKSVSSVYASAIGNFVQQLTLTEDLIAKLVMSHLLGADSEKISILYYHLSKNVGFRARCNILQDLIKAEANEDEWQEFKTLRLEFEPPFEFRNEILHRSISIAAAKGGPDGLMVELLTTPNHPTGAKVLGRKKVTIKEITDQSRRLGKVNSALVEICLRRGLQ